MIRNFQTRRGFSYLEVQVAAILLAVGVSGIAPVVVIQSRQAVRIADRLPDEGPIYLSPVSGDWHRRLGALAQISSEAAPTLTPQRNIRVLSNQSDWPLFTTNAGWAGHQHWEPYYDPLAYGNELRWHYADHHYGADARWQFTDLQPGYYEVYTTHSPRSYWHQAAPFQIYDGGTLLHSQDVDQRSLPNDYSYDGQTWERLGTVRIVSGILQVRLIDQTSHPGYLAANAVLVRPIEVVSVQEMASVNDTQASCTIRITTP